MKRVLAVDDSRTLRDMLVDCLTGAGHQVYVAGDGAEALNALREHRPDIVITDLNMPGMSGLDLTAKTRAHTVLKAIPVFVATSEVYCSTLDRSHINGVIPKPFSVATMKTALESVIGALT